MRRILTVSVLLLISFVFIQKNTSAENLYLPEDNFDRVILKFRPLIPLLFKRNAVGKYGLSLSENLRLADTFVVRVPKDKVEELTGRLQKNLLIEYAEQDYLADIFEIPNDPEFQNQWGLSKIEVSGAWDVTHGASDVDIAIVDTGINADHPDLASKVTSSVNCTIASSCPSVAVVDPNGHGTHVSGIASAVTNNSLGVAGASWEGRLMSVKVLNDNGSGYYSWVANGIVWAVDNGAEVINLSLGGSYPSSTLKNAINYAWNNGTVVVVAAGNQGRSFPRYPAYYSNSIAVAATDENDQRASFSNYGTWVDVAAPGISILSTYRGAYEYFSGTSMSTPFVSGLAALLFGQNPEWNNIKVRDRIEETADAISGTGTYWRHGRINACEAIGCGSFVGPTATPTPRSTPTLTPTPTLSPTPTPIPPTPSPTPEATPTPIPTPTPSLPWWCRYIPWHRTCR